MGATTLIQTANNIIADMKELEKERKIMLSHFENVKDELIKLGYVYANDEFKKKETVRSLSVYLINRQYDCGWIEQEINGCLEVDEEFMSKVQSILDSTDANNIEQGKLLELITATFDELASYGMEVSYVLIREDNSIVLSMKDQNEDIVEGDITIGTSDRTQLEEITESDWESIRLK